MKSAVLHQVGGPFSIEDVELLPPRKGEVRVRLKAAGLCHSDWHFVEGKLGRPFPLILGHEGAGVIEELGEGVTTLRKGQRVVLNWAPCCHHCYYCQHGDTGLCETFWRWRDGTMADGSTRFRIGGKPARQFSVLSTFTEQTIAPVESVVPIDDDISFEVAALVGCGVTTGVGAALNTVDIRPGDSAAVYGCGGVGLNVVQGARLSNAHPIIAVDSDPAKQEIAVQFGATHFVLAGDRAHEQVKELTGGRGVDWAFEAVGPPVGAGGRIPGDAPRRCAGDRRRGAGGFDHVVLRSRSARRPETHPGVVLRFHQPQTASSAACSTSTAAARSWSMN